MFIARIKWSRNAIPEEYEFESKKDAQDYIASKESHPMFRWAEIDTKRKYSKRGGQAEKKALIADLTHVRRVGAMKFKVTIDAKGGASITGPSDYMDTLQYRNTFDAIANGTHVLIGAFPLGTPISTMTEVILQTDYAAYLGMKQLAGMRKH